jgi:hypothetical protein
MRIALASLVLFVWSAVASAEEPIGFAEFPWGTSQSQIYGVCQGADRRVLPPSTPYSDGTVGILCHSRALQFSDGEAWNFQLYFFNGVLVGYQITPRREYDELRRIAVAKFGPPTKQSVGEYVNGAGARVSGETLSWTWSSGTAAELAERYDRLDSSSLIVYSKAFADAKRRGSQEAVDRAKKSF